MVLKSDSAGYTVANNYFPPGGAVQLAFEARSKTDTPIRFAGRKNGRVVKLGKEWAQYEIATPEIFIERHKFFLTLEKAGEVELRNVKVLTPNKTVMMAFEFH